MLPPLPLGEGWGEGLFWIRNRNRSRNGDASSGGLRPPLAFFIEREKVGRSELAEPDFIIKALGTATFVRGREDNLYAASPFQIRQDVIEKQRPDALPSQGFIDNKRFKDSAASWRSDQIVEHDRL